MLLALTDFLHLFLVFEGHVELSDGLSQFFPNVAIPKCDEDDRHNQVDEDDSHLEIDQVILNHLSHALVHGFSETATVSDSDNNFL